MTKHILRFYFVLFLLLGGGFAASKMGLFDNVETDWGIVDVIPDQHEFKVLSASYATGDGLIKLERLFDGKVFEKNYGYRCDVIEKRAKAGQVLTLKVNYYVMENNEGQKKKEMHFNNLIAVACDGIAL